MYHLKLTFCFLLFVLTVCNGQQADMMMDNMANQQDGMLMDGNACPMRSHDGPYSYDPTSMTGPTSWGFLMPQFAACTTGMQQSPIDFPMSVDLDFEMNAPRISLLKSNMTLKPLPFNWELVCSEEMMCGSTMFNGSTYYVTKVRFTRPSEHTLNGSRYPFEAIIEQRSMESNRTVSLVRLFNVQKEDGYFQKIAQKAMFDVGMNDVVGDLLHQVMSNDMNMSSPKPIMTDLAAIIPTDSGFCSYMGSQTMPPCTEGVRYFLSMDVGIISKKQLHHFWAMTGFSFDGNNRPTKPINGRKITCFIKPDMMAQIEERRNNMTMSNPNITMNDGDEMMNGGAGAGNEATMAEGSDNDVIINI